MKNLLKAVCILLALLLCLSPLLALAEASIDESEKEVSGLLDISYESIDDSHIEVEQASPDYSIIFTLIIGVLVAVLVGWWLFKPKKKDY